MSNIVRARITIEGARSLLQCHFGEETISMEKKEKKGVAGRNPEEWKDTCMLTEEGQMYILPTYIFGCLRNGAKFTKKGRGSMQADLQSTLQVEEDDRILVQNRFVKDKNNLHKTTAFKPKDKNTETFIFVTPVINPNTRGRNIRYRLAASPGWRLQFTIMWDRTIIPCNTMRSILIDSGTFGGLGDGIKIGFGRFRVLKYEELELPPELRQQHTMEIIELDHSAEDNGFMEDEYMEEEEEALPRKRL